MYLNRFICSVFEEMRALHKTRNYGGLLGLIEEAQAMANRMEGALEDKKQLTNYHELAKKEEKRYKKLKAKVDKLKEKSKKSE